MPLRFRRSLRIAPGVRLNLSKSGVSTSLGRRGAHLTIGHGRIRRTIGLLGTGLSYTTSTRIGTGKRPPFQPSPRPHILAWLVSAAVVLILIVLWRLSASG